jgi:predicted dehydrogenase
MMKVAVAGLGWWGKQIIRCLDKSAKFEVLCGVDPKPPADIGDFAKEFRIALETDLAAVLKDPKVEGVVLATPHLLHEEQVLAVLAAGKHVFCEKPLTMTGAGAQRMVDACQKAGKVLGIGHERRWEPAFEELGRLIASGALGKILHMDANISHNLFRKLDASNWRLDPAHAPAGMMTATGIHVTDLFVSWAGPAAEVRAQTARLIFQPPAEDFVSASMTFRSGARGSITLLSCTPYYGRFTVYGDAAWVEIVSEANVDQGKPTHLMFGDGTVRKVTTYQATDTVTQNFEAWADAVEGRGSYRFTAEQLVGNIRLFEAIVQSSRQGGATIQL